MATVGLDFGTTNSCVAVYVPSPTSYFGHVKVLKLDVALSNSIIPSLLSFSRATSATSTAANVNGARSQCEIGTKAASPCLSSFTRALSHHTPTLSITRPTGATTTLTPASAIEAFLKATREAVLRCTDVAEPVSVVLTHPAAWPHSLKSTLITAATSAGFSKVTLMSESTAAGQSYGVLTNSKPDSAYMVIDVGGGTTDVSIMSNVPSSASGNSATGNDNSSTTNFRVVGVAGDNNLGGDDVDALVAEWFQPDAALRTKELLEACCAAKIVLCGKLLSPDGLSKEDDWDSAEPPPTSTDVTSNDVTKTLSIQVFKKLLKPLTRQFEDVITKARTQANLDTVETVLLTGGSSKLPTLPPTLVSLFGPKVKILNDVNPFSCVAIGAALRGAVLSGEVLEWQMKNALMSEILPHDMGLLADGDSLIPICTAGSSLPVRNSAMFEVADLSQGGVCFMVAENVGDGQIEEVAEFRFLLWSLTEEQKKKIEDEEGGIRQLELFIEVDSEGRVIVEVFDKYDPEHLIKFGKVDAAEGKELLKSNAKTAMYVLLFLVYIAVRIAFNVVTEYEVQDESGVAASDEKVDVTPEEF
jgi:molecular chaperone DnaK